MSGQKQTIIIGITGGIAAYKIADLVSMLTKNGYDVHVIMTENATKIISPLTMRTLSSNPVLVDTFDVNSPWKVQHIGIAEAADLMVIVPATANIIAKMAYGIADDLLSTVYLAAKAPIVVVPSMNTNMYEHPTVQENLERLRNRGHYILEPAEGELACGVSGKGRLPDLDEIYNIIVNILNPCQDFAGKTFIITAGTTQESLDPVRFITNHSTGKMGYALAAEAAKRGARVILVSGPTSLPDPPRVEVHRVKSACDMYDKCMSFFDKADVVIGAAAVADYRPVECSDLKLKKKDEDLVLQLTRNPDILGDMGKMKKNQILVGFAAETNDVLENGREKMLKKNLDLLVANDVTMEGAGFGSDTNIVTLIYRGGRLEPVPKMRKEKVAQVILDAIANIINKVVG